MQKILIFRSSNFAVLDKLLFDINKKYNNGCSIYLLVQEETHNMIKDKYKDLKFFVTKNGFFDYDDYIKNTKLRSLVERNKYDYIYIPLSTNNINDALEIQHIITKIKKKKTFIFTVDLSYYKINGNYFSLNLREKIRKVFMDLTNIYILIICKSIISISLIYNKLKIRKKKDG